MTRTVKVVLDADTGPYRREVKSSVADTEAADRAVDKLKRSTEELGPAGRTGAQGVKEVGQKARSSAVDLALLSKELDKAKDNLRQLQRAAVTGELLPGFSKGELTKARSYVSELERLKKDLTPNIPGVGKAGAQGARVTSMLGPLAVSSGDIMPVAGAVAAYFGPPISAAISGGIITAIGGGALAGGIAAQLNNPAVKSAVTSFGQSLLSSLQDASRSIGPALISALGPLKTQLDPLFDRLRTGFEGLAPFVRPLGELLGQAMAKLGPGISAIMAKAGPMLIEFGKALQPIAAGLSSFFKQIADGSKGGAEALRVLGAALGSLLGWLGLFIKIGSGAFDALIQAIDKVLRAISFITALMPAKQAEAFRSVSDKVHELATAGNEATPAMENLSGGLGDVSASATGAAGAIFALDVALNDYLSKTLSADQATLQWNQGMLALKESFRQNGASLDENTAAGQANMQAMLGQIAMAEQSRQRNIDNGMAVDEANAAYDRQIQELLGVARQSGATKAQLDALAGKYLITVETKGLALATSQAQYFASILDSIPTSIVTTTYLRTVYGQGNYVASAFARAEGGIVERAGGGIVEHAATGTLREANVYRAGGSPLYAFAEPDTGGELFVPKHGNLARSRSIMDYGVTHWLGGQPVNWSGAPGGGGSPSITVQLGVGAPPSAAAGDRAMSVWINRLIRTGQIQVSGA